MWGFLRSLGRKIVGAGKTVGRAILGGAKGARNVISSGWDNIKKVPVLGPVLQTIAERVPIPFLGGKTMQSVANSASAGLDAVDKMAQGDNAGAVEAAKRIELKRGGKVGHRLKQLRLKDGGALTGQRRAHVWGAPPDQFQQYQRQWQGMDRNY